MTDESPKEEILINVTPREVRAALRDTRARHRRPDRSAPGARTRRSRGRVDPRPIRALRA